MIFNVKNSHHKVKCHILQHIFYYWLEYFSYIYMYFGKVILNFI